MLRWQYRTVYHHLTQDIISQASRSSKSSSCTGRRREREALRGWQNATETLAHACNASQKCWQKCQINPLMSGGRCRPRGVSWSWSRNCALDVNITTVIVRRTVDHNTAILHTHHLLIIIIMTIMFLVIVIIVDAMMSFNVFKCFE